MIKFTDDIIIGLEIHVELNTKSKLFCSCATQGNDSPNSRTCSVCLGHPGSKPVVNKKAIEYAIKLASALNCQIADSVIFSRKSYFYPDLAKNYQITQYKKPIGQIGSIKISDRKIGITRVHLEEDPAALVHPSGINSSKYVLVDYNRSGNPLCEIVTEPDIRSPKEARDFMKNLITILQYLKIFDPKKNIIKADANISIKESGYIRSEIKNITGFKDIESALSYEIMRQKQEGIKIQQTRSWDSVKKTTSLLRKKETEEDYGYIFDPDLVPIDITHDWLDRLKKEIPELPLQKYERYIKNLKISKDDAKVITSDYRLTNIFEKSIQKIDPILAAKWIRKELIRVLNYNKIEIENMNIDEDQFISLLEIIQDKKITNKVGQNIIEILIVKNIDVKKYIKENNLESMSDSGELKKICSDAISQNEKAVSDYKSGKVIALNAILGTVMRMTKGKANPKDVKDILISLLK